MKTFDRIVVIANPVSMHADRTKRRIVELQAMFPATTLVTIETSPDGRDANAALIRSHAHLFNSHTLLCIAAGDGTIHAIVQTLLLDDELPTEARDVIILPLWGGNANDLASMLNGTNVRRPFSKIFQSGSVVQIRPICFTLTTANKTSRRVAVTTASFGSTARVAMRLNDLSHRRSFANRLPGGRAIREAVVAWMTVMMSPVFTVEENKQSKIMYEYTFANGQRFAKLYRMPISIDDDHFYFDAIQKKYPFVTATALALSFKRRFRPERLRRQVEFVVKEDVWAQFDGETEQIPAGTVVMVTQLATVLNTWSTLH